MVPCHCRSILVEAAGSSSLSLLAVRNRTTVPIAVPRYRLVSDPRGVATTFYLLGDKSIEDLGFDTHADCQSLCQITHSLWHISFRLSDSGDLYLEGHTPANDKPGHLNILFQHLPLEKHRKRLYRGVQATRKRISRLLLPTKRYLLDHSTFFLLRNEIFIPFLAILLGLFIYGIITAVLMKRNANLGDWNYSPPLNADTYLIIGILVQASL